MLSCNHPFYSANDFYRQKFGAKLIKLAIDGGFTCPNRDGTLSDRGCIFCSGRGSGDFTAGRLSIKEQYDIMRKKMSDKWGEGLYMMYLQAFTNTYAPVERLREIYTKAIECENVAALSIATRPDCIDEEKAELLKELSKKVYVCVELGLQTTDEKSVRLINRCYENDTYQKCVGLLSSYGIDVITHVILGLPNENRETMLNTVKYAADCGTRGIKLQLLHILKNTALYDYYINTHFHVLSYEEYVGLVCDIIERIPQDIVIHRITGDGNKAELFAPRWSLDKRRVLNGISKEFVRRNSYQGIYA